MTSGIESGTRQLKSLWTFPRFLIANGIVLLFIIFGLNVKAVAALRLNIAGFHLSSVFLWYLAISVIWWVIIASFVMQKARERSLYEKFSLGISISVWIGGLIPAWLLFAGSMWFYVVTKISQLG